VHLCRRCVGWEIVREAVFQVDEGIGNDFDDRRAVLLGRGVFEIVNLQIRQYNIPTLGID